MKIVWLDIATAALALTAAALWFWSAATNPPEMKMYWGAAPPNDPFFAWVRSSATLNRWAAGFTGASALCAGIRALVDAARRASS